MSDLQNYIFAVLIIITGIIGIWMNIGMIQHQKATEWESFLEAPDIFFFIYSVINILSGLAFMLAYLLVRRVVLS